MISLLYRYFNRLGRGLNNNIMITKVTNRDLIFVKYGNNPENMIDEMLDKAEILNDIPHKDALIGIKPNLVLAKPSESGATTCPRLVETVIRYLKARGFHNMVVLEG